jgi:hypothetical protein
MATTTKTPRRPHGQGRPLDEARAALMGVRKDLRTGGRDLFGDVERFVHSARRHASKLGTALRADVGRLVRITPLVNAPPARRRAAPKPRRTAGSQPKKTAA